MKHLDLFSGIGGFSLAADRVWPNVEHTFVEIDPFCQAVLRKHWPKSYIHDDIRTLTNTQYDGFDGAKTPKAIERERTVTRKGRTNFANLKEVIPYGLRLTSSPADSPASLLAKPDEGEARKTTVTSGQRCSGLLKSSSPLGLLVKMLLESSTWYSNKCALTWKPKAMKSNRLLFQLSPSTHPTGEIGYGLLPTARTTDAEGGAVKNATMSKKGSWSRLNKDGTRHGIKVKDVIAGTKTGLKLQPPFVEWMMGYPDGWTEIPDSRLLEMRLSRKLQRKL